jgi:hypothetical protein
MTHRNFFLSSFFVYAGLALSLILVLFILSHVDWSLFFTTIQQVQPVWLLTATVLIVSGVFLRSLRWNLISGCDISNLRHFWDATNLGYLGNLVYPARAGEILRIIALKKFTPLSEGHALSSAFIDRLSDGIMIPVLLVILIEYFGQTINIPYQVRLFSLFFVGISFFIFFFIIWGKGLKKTMIRWLFWLPESYVEKISLWYCQAHEGASVLKKPRRLFVVICISFLAFLLDSLVYFALFLAFGWDLSFPVAILICVFILAGSTLPSSPGYFGIYQVACILAFHPFGIPDTASVAYSLVLQCIIYTIFLIIGGWIMYTRRISFTRIQLE